MEEFESIEQSLRGIAPRRPSPAIATRLFRRAAVEPQVVAGLFTSVGQWLVPVAGCLLLAVSSLTTHPTASRSFSHPPLAAGGSLQDNGAYLSAAASFHSEQNNPPRTSLEWSLATPDLSPPLPQPVTNTLRR